MIVSIERRVDGVLTSADTATLRVTSIGGTIWVNDEVVAPTSAGIYSYTTPGLPDGEFVARWTFAVAGLDDDVIYRTFQVDQPVQYHTGVTLAEIERHVAPRIGPYEELIALPTSTQTTLFVSQLISSLDLGEYEDLYILRRGRFENGNFVSPFSDDDRERLVASYESATGGLNPDRDWTYAPVEGEMIELHVLKPSSELRKIVLQGLRRCYFWDTAVVSTTEAALTSGNTRTNLTALVPWLTRPNQLKNIQFGTTVGLPSRVMWWDADRQGANVNLSMLGLGAGSLYIHALRPHITYVNGEMSYRGPDDDDDILHVDLDYAAAAAHAAAWQLVPHRLFPISNVGMRISMEAAAAEFTRESMRVVEQMPEFIRVRFGSEDRLMEMPQVGNV